MKMKVAIIMSIILLTIVAGAVIAAYFSGKSQQKADSKAACTALRATDRTNYSNAQTEAEKKARQKQKELDDFELSRLRGMLAKAQQAALKAQKAATNADARSARLADTLQRLRHEDQTVERWNDTCLPASLLGELHPDVRPEAYPSSCKRASDGDQARLPAHPKLAAPGH